MPLDFAVFHAAVTAAFAKNPYDLMRSKARGTRIRERNHITVGDGIGGDFSVDDWDLV